jgi:hypothetical protein
MENSSDRSDRVVGIGIVRGIEALCPFGIH